MHPILAKRDRLTVYLVAWLPVAAMLAGMLVLSGGSPWTEAVALTLPLVTVYAFLCLTAWYPCKALPLRGTNAAKALATHLVTAVVSASLWSTVALGLARVIDREGLFPGVEERIRDQLALVVAAGLLLYLLAVAVHYLVVTFETSREADRRALSAEIQAREAELRALRAQLDPHFLFNSLNSISSLMIADPQGARTMCVNLGDFLRASLRLGARTTVTLEEEMQTLDLYLQVERIRFGERLKVELNVDSSCLPCAVPPLVLQPLVENALKHGISTLLEGGTVSISAERSPENLILIVENPVDQPASTSDGSGLGLINLRHRLDNLYGKSARLKTGTQEDTYWVQVSLPFNQGEATA